MHLTTYQAHVGAMRDLLVDHLELVRYPVAEIELVDRGDERVEIVARLVSTAVTDSDLDAVAAHLARHESVEHATWEVQTQD